MADLRRILTEYVGLFRAGQCETAGEVEEGSFSRAAAQASVEFGNLVDFNAQQIERLVQEIAETRARANTMALAVDVVAGTLPSGAGVVLPRLRRRGARPQAEYRPVSAARSGAAQESWSRCSRTCSPTPSSMRGAKAESSRFESGPAPSSGSRWTTTARAFPSRIRSKCSSRTCAGKVSPRRASGWDSRPSSAWQNRTAAVSASDRLRERAAPSGSRYPVRTAPAPKNRGRGLQGLGRLARRLLVHRDRHLGGWTVRR